MTTDTARFLTFEGIEGVGKSTQIARLARILEGAGIAPVVTREPGGTPLAETIRRIVLDAGDESLPATAELLLMFAARAVHLANLIEPQLRAGSWVLCDRFTDATYAYQGAGRGMGDASIAVLENLVQGARRPDLTLLLDAPVEVAWQRAQARNQAAAVRRDRFESEHREFFERVRGGYLARAAAAAERMVVIDATGSESEVSDSILNCLRERAWIS